MWEKDINTSKRDHSGSVCPFDFHALKFSSQTVAGIESKFGRGIQFMPLMNHWSGSWISHYSYVRWASEHLNSPAFRVIDEPFVKADITGHIKYLYYWPFVREPAEPIAIKYSALPIYHDHFHHSTDIVNTSLSVEIRCFLLWVLSLNAVQHAPLSSYMQYRLTLGLGI